MKERETNRGRATMTLLEEALSAAKGGKPISLAALKGFAFAWLFPRTLIVVGSIVTAALLGAQTFIIYKQLRAMELQTDLLAKQTKAIQLEQIEKLRTRLAANIALRQRLSTATQSVTRLIRESAGQCAEICAAARYLEALEVIAKPPPASPPYDNHYFLNQQPWVFLKARLLNAEVAVKTLAGGANPGAFDKAILSTDELKLAMAAAQLNCSASLSSADSVLQDYRTLRLVADGTRTWETSPTGYQRYRYEYAPNIARLVNPSGNGFDYQAMTIGEFNKFLGVVEARMEKSLGEIATTCAARVQADQTEIAEPER